jgi:hypothetical protein
LADSLLEALVENAKLLYDENKADVVTDGMSPKEKSLALKRLTTQAVSNALNAARLSGENRDNYCRQLFRELGSRGGQVASKSRRKTRQPSLF